MDPQTIPRYLDGKDARDAGMRFYCRKPACVRSHRRTVLGHDQDSAEKQRVGSIVALDCEMVGVGPRGRRSVLARVSMVNVYGHRIYDTYVKPNETVSDYRTTVSGVCEADLLNAPGFATVRRQVQTILTGRILVGHAVRNDLRVLQLEHPIDMIRDTSSWPAYKELVGVEQPGLKVLFETQFDGLEIQPKGRAHSSIEDAQAAMALYRNGHEEWCRLY